MLESSYFQFYIGKKQIKMKKCFARYLVSLKRHQIVERYFRNVLRMTDIKTDIGYARAFVRLALERKLLHKHLKTILGNTHLLQ